MLIRHYCPLQKNFLARLTISSHRLLHIIAEDINIPIEALTHEQLIAWFEKDSKIRHEKEAKLLL